MSNYTKSTNFATKDNLTPGDPLKVVRGTEIDTEFNNIATAIATKTDNASAAITGGSITGITDLAIADGGTGASTATAALNNLLPSQTGNANKYLQTDGTNATWDAVSLSTADITGTLPVANGGTGVTSSTGTGSVVLSNSPTLVTPALGTPASGVATNLTGLPISTGVSGLGTGVATFLATPSSANLASAVSDETGTGSLVFANSPTLVTPALGTPSALVGTNITGTASGLTAGNVTTNANLTGAVTSVGNATSLGSFSSANLLGALTDETGTGSAVFATSPTLVTPILGTPTSATLTNATGLPISTGVSGLGTGVATALAVNVGSAGAPVVNGGALGTPSSGTVTNLTGTASININGTVGATTPSSGAFTTLAASSSVTLSGGTANGVTYLNGSKVLTSGSALTFDGTNLLVGTASSIFTTTVLQATSATTQVAGLQQTGGASNSALTTWNTGTTGPIYQHKFAYGAGGSLAGSITTDSSGNTSYNSAGAVVFGYSGTTEGMRLTSTGLGIGTSSPSSFDSSWNKLVLGGGSGDVGQTIYSGSASIGTIAFADGTTGAQQYAGLIRYLHSSNSMTFWTNAGIKATLDSAGNLGLGVTPSAWRSGASALQLGATGYASLNEQANGSTSLNFNCFESAANTWTYRVTGVAPTRYTQLSGAHNWFTAASGTAGNAISFTQALTLDANGDFLVGKTTSDGRLTVKGSTSNGSTYTAYMTNSSNTELFAVRTDGLFETGLAANSPYNLTTATAANVHIDSQGWMYRSTSSLKYKTDVQDATHGLEKVMALRPVTYKGKNDGDTVFGGLIAEEVHEAGLTEFVQYAEDGTPDALAYGQMVSLAFKAIQELKAEFDAYKATHP